MTAAPMNDPIRSEDRPQALFHAALQLSVAARGDFLDRECTGDAGLRRHLERLLRLHEQAEQRLRDPAEPVRERPGDRIGHYHLRQRIGEGGFGTVWLAEQEQPVQRRVALKILKAGMDTAEVVARFAAERQALARMEHPHIARVFDGGATPQGRPYFAMEFVDGVPITQYCDAASLSPRERVELFVPVCQAVQHAHFKGVIHRDLKPSNVLVTMQDGVPVPKVIDFGIAKATEGRLTERTKLTRLRQMIGTPDYMAPEQADPTGLDVDSRADVYSLGVLLYELLTGARPFELQTLLQAGYAELLRTIREVEPQKPSTRISTLGEQLPHVARHRRMHPRALGPAIRGDLDWIVMKTLEKDRTRRYDTAAALADDLGRHLRSEPVQAGPPDRLYRLRKYVRRHRVGVAAGASVALALLAGAAAAGWGYFAASEHARLAEDSATRANEERAAAVLARTDEAAQRELAEQRAAEARREAAKSRHVIDLLETMLASSSPHEQKGKDYTVRQLLDDFERSTLSKLGDEPEVKLALLRTVSRSYLDLGLPARAEPHVAEARTLAAERFGADSEQAAESEAVFARYLHACARYADAAAAYSALLVAHGERFPAARTDAWRSMLADCERQLGHHDRAVSILEELIAEQQGRAGDTRVAIASSQQSLLVTLIDRNDPGDLGAAEPLARSVLATQRELLAPEAREISASLNNLARVIGETGQTAEAERLFAEALERHTAYFGADHPEVAWAKANLAEFLRRSGQPARAEPMLREAVATYERLGTDPVNHAWALNLLGAAIFSQARDVEAASIWRKCLEIRRREHRDHDAVARTLQNLAFAVPRTEKEERRRLLEESLAMRIRLHGPEHAEVAVAQTGLGSELMQQRELEPAETLLRASLATQQKTTPGPTTLLMSTTQTLGNCLVLGGKLEEGLRLLEESLAAGRAVLPQAHTDLAGPLLSIALAQWQRGELDAAVTAFREAVEIRRAAFGPTHAMTIVPMRSFVDLLLDRGQADEARRCAAEIVATMRGSTPVGGPSLAAALIRQARAERLTGDAEAAETLLREALASCAEASPRDVKLASEQVACAAYLLDTGRPAEAEPLLRECLGLFDPAGPQDVQRWIVASLLGGALAQQDRCAEAEPLLLAAAERLPRHLSMPHGRALRDTWQRLVDLYTRWGKPADAERWRRAASDARGAAAADARR